MLRHATDPARRASARWFRHTPAGALLRPLIPLVAASFAVAACTPYAVATTARPLAVGESQRTAIYTMVPGGLELDSTRSVSVPGMDAEWRFGIDDRADMGLRVNSLSGVIATMKRRLDGPSSKPGAATAILGGLGIVNMGQHAHAELTLIRSGDETRPRVPYGGVRILHIAPLATDAVHDTPAAGAFFGTRFGTGRIGIALELGAYYDRSALGMRRRDFIIVPSVALYRNRAARD